MPAVKRTPTASGRATVQPAAGLTLTAVDQRDRALLHEQVAAAIRRAIADGEAGPGDRIPKAKDLATVLGVNTNTVLRALRTLQDEGLLELRRGKGITVAGTPERSAVIDAANDLLKLARHHGYRRDELIGILQNLPG
jgi:GntR family transcriptional regulator